MSQKEFGILATFKGYYYYIFAPIKNDIDLKLYESVSLEQYLTYINIGFLQNHPYFVNLFYSSYILNVCEVGKEAF